MKKEKYNITVTKDSKVIHEEKVEGYDSWITTSRRMDALKEKYPDCNVDYELL